MGTLLKKVLSVATAVAGVSGTVLTVTEVTERIIYKNVHEIETTDVYMINGSEVDYQDWIDMQSSILAGAESEEAIDTESDLIFYFGSASDYRLATASDMGSGEVDLAHGNDFHVSAGNQVTGESEYVIVMIDDDYEVASWKASGFDVGFGSCDIGDFTVFYLTSESYDEDLGGIDYTVTFSEIK